MVQTRQLGGDVNGRGADGGVTDAATAVEIVGYTLGGQTVDSRVVEARRAGRWSWVGTNVAEDVSSVSSEFSWKAFVESGERYGIALTVEERVTGEQ